MREELSAERFTQWRMVLSNEYDMHLPAEPVGVHIHSTAIFVEILLIRLDVTREHTAWFFSANTNVPAYGELQYAANIARDLVTYGYGRPWWMTEVKTNALYGMHRGIRVTPGHTWRYTVYLALANPSEGTNSIYICRIEET